MTLKEIVWGRMITVHIADSDQFSQVTAMLLSAPFIDAAKEVAMGINRCTDEAIMHHLQSEVHGLIFLALAIFPFFSFFFSFFFGGGGGACVCVWGGGGGGLI